MSAEPSKTDPQNELGKSAQGLIDLSVAPTPPM
jgi:hypothetical protein